MNLPSVFNVINKLKLYIKMTLCQEVNTHSFSSLIYTAFVSLYIFSKSISLFYLDQCIIFLKYCLICVNTYLENIEMRQIYISYNNKCT